MSVMTLAVGELNATATRTHLGLASKTPQAPYRHVTRLNSASPAAKRPAVKDRAHPNLTRRHPVHPGGRPESAGAVLISTAKSHNPAVSSSANAAILSERGLALIIVGFLVAMVAGAVVVLAQFGAISAPQSAIAQTETHNVVAQAVPVGR